LLRSYLHLTQQHSISYRLPYLVADRKSPKIRSGGIVHSHEEISAGFPLVLTTDRVAVHHNAGSMTRRSPSLMERAPELFVEIHPTDAAQLGIAEGEALVVTTARGNATAKARITDKVRAGAALCLSTSRARTN